MLDAPASTNELANELRAATSRLRSALDHTATAAPVSNQLTHELSAINDIADQIDVAMSTEPVHVRILVVDDTEVNRTVLTAQLQLSLIHI